MKLPPLIYNSIGKFFFFVLLETVCVLLIINNSIVQKYRIMEGVRQVQSFFWSNSTAIKNYTQLRLINKELVEENSRLLKQNAFYKDYISREQGAVKLEEISAQLKTNMGNSRFDDYSFTLAKVIKNTLNSSHNYLIIDKGKKDGITEDLGVITPSGIVGIVRATGERFCYVMSFLNSQQSISAKIGKDELLGTLKWEGRSIRTAHLTEVALSAQITKGDTVYTSGNSSFFPSDIPVGEAVSTSIVDGAHQKIEVKLFQDFANLSYVIIVKNNNKREIDSLSAIKPVSTSKK